MREFFRGWKRKAGIVTLATACLLLAGWIRSLRDYDVVSLGDYFGTRYFVGSIAQSLVLSGATPPRGPKGIDWDTGSLRGVKSFETNWSGLLIYYQQDPWARFDVEWRWDWAGFHAGSGIRHDVSDGRQRTTRIEIPYWSVVIPMTLLSGWLLLSKRPPANRPPEST